jgi:hypothetical protein
LPQKFLVPLQFLLLRPLSVKRPLLLRLLLQKPPRLLRLKHQWLLLQKLLSLLPQKRLLGLLLALPLLQAKVSSLLILF